jgi:site-specific recombinase XerD
MHVFSRKVRSSEMRKSRFYRKLLLRKFRKSSLSKTSHEVLVASHPKVEVVSESSPVLLKKNFSIEDLIRPGDHLKTHLESFLLDQRSLNTRRAYSKDLKRFVRFLHARHLEQGNVAINRVLVISYKEFLISENLEQTTVDRHLACLRSFFRWLKDDGVLDSNPVEGVRFLRPKRLSGTIGFSDVEVQKILSLPNLHKKSGSLHYAILMLLFYGGLRRSEICDLKLNHLFVERNQHLLKVQGKSNRERLIVLVPSVWNAMEHYFKISVRDFNSTKEEPLFLPVRNNRTKNLNKSLDGSSIFYMVQKYAKMAGILHRVSPHSCRATAISNARDHHVPDRAIQEFAGWSSTQMITTYDKRRTSIEDSPSHSISYGAQERNFPLEMNLVRSISKN